MIRQTVLFHGIDINGKHALFETDGTVAGTQEIAPISGANSQGIFPDEMTAFNGKVLFRGADTTDVSAGAKGGLWVTNGTAAGTYELTGISGANSAGIFTPGPGIGGYLAAYITAFNGTALFAGDDTNNQIGLWVTDGTVAGTQEIGGFGSTGISGVSSAGLHPRHMTVLNGAVLFTGADSGGATGLWVTDGTALGTHELTSIAGANSAGLNAFDLTVFGNEVLFAGDNTGGSFGLWMTNGTALGTQELTGIGGAFSGGINPSNMTVFGSAVLFEGENASGNFGLWMTDGTALGTHELTGIIGASSSGLSPTNLTVLNNKVLFSGIDAGGSFGLWVTDGTAEGTLELTGIVGANSDGIEPLGAMAVIGNEVLFNGQDAAGGFGLWATDGTVAGTHELTGISSASLAAEGIAPFDLTSVILAPVTVTVQAASGIDLRWATLYNEMANSPIGAGGTATQYTCVDSGQFNGQSAAIKFVVSGSDFTYSGSFPNIQLTGGAITGVQELDTSNNVLATFTGLSISATVFNSAMASYVAGGASPDPIALNAIFLAQTYQVTGGAGPDRLQGGNVNDTVIGSAGNDSINGGSGINTADYSGLTTQGLVAIVQGGAGTVNKGGANGVDSLTKVQDLIDNGTGRGNGDVFYVDSAENVAANTSNFNYLIELTASVTLSYGTNFTGISEFVSNVGTNTVDFSADTSFAYVYGSTGNDTLTLGAGGGYLFSGGGTGNLLTGGANATNFLVDSGGASTMNGGSGTAANYFYVAGASSDTVTGAGAFNAVIQLTAGVTVQLGSAKFLNVNEYVSNSGTNAVSVASTDHGFKYIYGGAGNDTLSTGSGGGYLIGEGGTNILTGGAGTNVFVADGGSGVDTMNGGSGSNVYFIDANSTVNGAGTFNTVIELQQNVALALGSAQLGTGVQEVVLNGGTNTVDFHTATAAVFLYGAAGSDTLIGGSGSDFLYGGAGTNTFGFKAGWGHDSIRDWTSGAGDQIDLTALASAGVHQLSDLTQTIVSGNDVITSSHTGTNSITLMGVGSALTASSFHFA